MKLSLKTLQHKSLKLVLIMVMLYFGKANATNLWSGTQVMPGNWSEHQLINNSLFNSIQVGDEIKITTTNVLSGGILILNNGNWKPLAGTGGIDLNSTVNEYKIIVTTLMKSELQSSGLIIGGINYTLTSVDSSAGNGGVGLEDAVYLGDLVIGNYDSFKVIGSGSFANAHVGDLLRIKIKNLKSGAQGHLFNGSWGDLTDATDFLQLSGDYYQFTITAAMLTLLQSTGMIVSGAHYTLTGVYIINPSNLPLPLNATVQVTNNWIWNSGETPVLNVSIANQNASNVNANVVLNVQTDKFEPFLATQTNVATVNAGSSIVSTFSLPISTPGFYSFSISVNDNLVKTFNIGYSPDSISSPVDAQSDFQSFWNTAKTDLAAVDPNYILTLIPEKSTSARKVYLVQMNSVGDATGNPVIIKGYYAEPTGNGTYPAIINYLGYDSGQGDPYIMSGNDNPGYAELILSTRGQSLNRANNPYGDWFVYSLGNKDDYYYRGAYMDAVRGIDFIASRTKIQTENIFAQGSSQGGALTIAAAALDTRIKAIAVGVTFMGDFPDYFKIGQWPAYPASVKQKEIGLSDVDMYKMLSYFDTKNLAPQITCPVLMASGLQDPVCPPHTNFAPYNNLKSTSYKEFHIYPLKQHETPDNWYKMYFDFFAQNSSTLSNPSIQNNSNNFKYVVKDKNLYLQNLSKNSTISVYSINGALINRIKTTSSMVTTLLPNSGIFVVVVNDDFSTKSIKILAK